MPLKFELEIILNILALSTTSTSGSIAIYKEDKISYISYLDIRVTHSERLMPQIDFGLKQSKLDISEINLVTLANGPGSFTGIRIGLATAKGICMANQIPLMPINTLELLAYNFYKPKLPILAIIDAKMNEVYTALYSTEHKELIKPQNADLVEFLTKIDQQVIIVGDGGIKFSEIIDNSNIKYEIAFPHQNIPLASTLISIVLQRSIPEYNFDSIADLEPFYLRKSQAEILKERG